MSHHGHKFELAAIIVIIVIIIIIIIILADACHYNAAVVSQHV